MWPPILTPSRHLVFLGYSRQHFWKKKSFHKQPNQTLASNFFFVYTPLAAVQTSLSKINIYPHRSKARSSLQEQGQMEKFKQRRSLPFGFVSYILSLFLLNIFEIFGQIPNQSTVSWIKYCKNYSRTKHTAYIIWVRWLHGSLRYILSIIDHMEINK